jgi:hypothetical protein
MAKVSNEPDLMVTLHGVNLLKMRVVSLLTIDVGSRYRSAELVSNP